MQKTRGIVCPNSRAIPVCHESAKCFSFMLVWSSPKKLGMLCAPLHMEQYVFLLGRLVGSSSAPLNVRVTHQSLAPVHTKRIVSWRADPQLKGGSSSFPVSAGSGWAGSGASGRCRFGSPCAVAACPAPWLRAPRRSWPGGTALAPRQPGQLPASPETRLGCLWAFLCFAC